jgi:drug/metabolite transporter (DMT)-like permease
MTETPADRPFKIFLASLACNALFACMNVFVKLASEHQSIVQIVFFRNAFALIPVTVAIYYAGGFPLLKTRKPGGHFLRASIGNLSMYFFFLAFNFLPLANALALTSASPLIQTVLSVPFLGEIVGPHRLAAVAVGLGAVLFMLQPSGGGNIQGTLSALVAAILTAFVMIIIRRLGRTEHHLTIVFYFTLFGALAGGIMALFFWMPVTPLTLFYLVMVGILGGGGQIFMTYAYAHAPMAYVSAFSYVSIIFGAFFDWLIWGHMLEWHIALGSAVIIAGGMYVLHRETLKRRTLAPEAVTLNE